MNHQRCRKLSETEKLVKQFFASNFLLPENCDFYGVLSSASWFVCCDSSAIIQFFFNARCWVISFLMCKSSSFLEPIIFFSVLWDFFNFFRSFFAGLTETIATLRFNWKIRRRQWHTFLWLLLWWIMWINNRIIKKYLCHRFWFPFNFKRRRRQTAKKSTNWLFILISSQKRIKCVSPNVCATHQTEKFSSIDHDA